MNAEDHYGRQDGSNPASQMGSKTDLACYLMNSTQTRTLGQGASKTETLAGMKQADEGLETKLGPLI